MQLSAANGASRAFSKSPSSNRRVHWFDSFFDPTANWPIQFDYLNRIGHTQDLRHAIVGTNSMLLKIELVVAYSRIHRFLTIATTQRSSVLQRPDPEWPPHEWNRKCAEYSIIAVNILQSIFELCDDPEIPFVVAAITDYPCPSSFISVQFLDCLGSRDLNHFIECRCWTIWHWTRDSMVGKERKEPAGIIVCEISVFCRRVSANSITLND